MRIVFGSDHGGYCLKETLRAFVVTLGHDVLDIGCGSAAAVDYPDFASAVCRKVLGGAGDRGILVCGSGVGMSMAANRFAGIRAALCNDLYTARLSREHNDANVLCLGGRILGEGLALEIVNLWLSTDFAGGRHLRRIEKFSSTP